MVPLEETYNLNHHMAELYLLRAQHIVQPDNPTLSLASMSNKIAIVFGWFKTKKTENFFFSHCLPSP